MAAITIREMAATTNPDDAGNGGSSRETTERQTHRAGRRLQAEQCSWKLGTTVQRGKNSNRAMGARAGLNPACEGDRANPASPPSQPNRATRKNRTRAPIARLALSPLALRSGDHLRTGRLRLGRPRLGRRTHGTSRFSGSCSRNRRARAGGSDRERGPLLTPGRPCSSPNPGARATGLQHRRNA